MILIDDTLIYRPSCSTGSSAATSRPVKAPAAWKAKAAPRWHPRRNSAEVEAAFPIIRKRLKPDSLAVIEREGLHVVDADGDHVTPIVNGKECVYATFDADGTAKCAFEQAHRAGEIEWQKPISCHLYPIRLTPLKDLTAVNYHQWPICGGAVSCGIGLNLSVLQFCKSSLTRRFGEAWFAEATVAEREWRQATEKGGQDLSSGPA